MINKLQSSITLHKVAASDSLKADSASSTSSIRENCFGSFFSCFKLSRKKECMKYFGDSEDQDYGYIVEKLIIKRVPFASFGMPKNILEIETNSCEDNFLKQQVLTEGNTKHPNISGTPSLLYYSDSLNQNTSVLNKRKQMNALLPDCNDRIAELMNTMISLHPDLKDSERPPKDPCPLNKSKQKSVSLEDFTEITSSEKSLNRSDRSNVQQTFMMPLTDTLKTNLMRKEGNYLRSPGESQSSNDSKNKEVLILQSVEDMIHNPTDFEKAINNANQSLAEEYDHKYAMIKPQSNSKLLCEQQQKMFIAESKTLTENIEIADLPPVTLRWKIMVKNCKPEL